MAVLIRKRLTRRFFNQKTEQVAQKLLGKILIREVGEQKITGIISETEAYLGIYDKACHASKGKTKRTKVMFGPSGFWYIYLIYGMYYCLNILLLSNIPVSHK